ncbi:branched-chain amino acid ABC transporter permease [Nocardioides sp. GXZ039]|uniref:branched-chain amino acid ABC transporter permease n=1 Tax=Nocardioides sp. GXZ039 TaxID=3136018 RepID=UPI0030F3C584
MSSSTASPTPRPPGRRGIVLGALVALLLAPLLALIALGAPSASAATAGAAPAGCQFPTSDDGAIHIQGCLRDQRTSPPTPVPDVKVSVTGPDGAVIGDAVTDANGIFDVALPGDPLSNLNKDFTIKIDTDTLPENAALRDPSQVELKVNFNTTNNYTVTFPIDEPLPDPPGKFIEGLQLLVGGIVFALLLAMASLGLSMIFGTTGLTNFAHGEMITFGALVGLWVDQLPGKISLPGIGNVTVIVGVLAAFVVGGIFGYVNDRALWRPLRHRGTGLIAMMIVSIGLSIFLRSVFQYLVGGNNKSYSQYSSVEPWSIGQILITPRDVAVVLVALAALIGVSLLLQYTRLGKATRAVADNPALAASSGINVERVIAAVWTVGGALAALSGVLLGITQGFNFQLGFKILLLVFAATVLGGLGTIWGAMLGALVIGAFVEVSTLWIPSELKYVGALVILILVLLVRPQGLLGRAQRIG